MPYGMNLAYLEEANMPFKQISAKVGSQKLMTK